MTGSGDERILVTAFEPWGDHRVNTSAIAIEGLDGEVVGGCRILVRQLPVEWEVAPERVLAAIADVDPAAVVSFGMHTGDAWRVELIARNRDIRDGGDESVIVEDAPRSLTTGLPAAAMLGALLEAGLPATLSEDAGSFLCNHVFFWTMHAAREGAAPPVSGFVHVPAPVFDEDATPGDPPRNADALQEGARLVLETVAVAVEKWRRS